MAGNARKAFFDEVVFVSLAELREEDLLVNMVTDRLGLGERSARPPIELLVEHLTARRLLLVLDNCEHLIEACAALAEALVESCPGVVVLATSRQSLGVAGERVVPVAPLAVPEPGESPAGLEQYDAVRLLRLAAVTRERTRARRGTGRAPADRPVPHTAAQGTPRRQAQGPG